MGTEERVFRGKVGEYGKEARMKDEEIKERCSEVGKGCAEGIIKSQKE